MVVKYCFHEQEALRNKNNTQQPKIPHLGTVADNIDFTLVLKLLVA